MNGNYKMPQFRSKFGQSAFAIRDNELIKDIQTIKSKVKGQLKATLHNNDNADSDNDNVNEQSSAVAIFSYFSLAIYLSKVILDRKPSTVYFLLFLLTLLFCLYITLVYCTV